MRTAISDLEARVERLENNGPGCFFIVGILAAIFLFMHVATEFKNDYYALKAKVRALEEKL